VTARVKRGLEVDSSHGRMLNGELDNLANFMLVDAALDGGNERHAESDGSKPIQSAELLLKKAGFVADDPVRFSVEPVELEVERGPHLIQVFQETIIAGDTFTVGVDHYKRNAPILRGPHEVDDLRMDRRLTTRKLDDLGTAFRSHKFIEHRFHFFQSQAEAGTSFGETERSAAKRPSPNRRRLLCVRLLDMRVQRRLPNPIFGDRHHKKLWPESQQGKPGRSNLAGAFVGNLGRSY
jgi:hypothetical protein